MLCGIDGAIRVAILAPVVVIGSTVAGFFVYLVLIQTLTSSSRVGTKGDTLLIVKENLH